MGPHHVEQSTTQHASAAGSGAPAVCWQGGGTGDGCDEVCGGGEDDGDRDGPGDTDGEDDAFPEVCGTRGDAAGGRRRDDWRPGRGRVRSLCRRGRRRRRACSCNMLCVFVAPLAPLLITFLSAARVAATDATAAASNTHTAATNVPMPACASDVAARTAETPRTHDTPSMRKTASVLSATKTPVAVPPAAMMGASATRRSTPCRNARDRSVTTASNVTDTDTATATCAAAEWELSATAATSLHTAGGDGDGAGDGDTGPPPDSAAALHRCRHASASLGARSVAATAKRIVETVKKTAVAMSSHVTCGRKEERKEGGGW